MNEDDDDDDDMVMMIQFRSISRIRRDDNDDKTTASNPKWRWTNILTNKKKVYILVCTRINDNQVDEISFLSLTFVTLFVASSHGLSLIY